MIRRTFFYATPADIQPVLRSFESNEPLKFVEWGYFDAPETWSAYLNSSEIPNLGVSTNESGGLSKAYIVMPRDVQIIPHSFVMENGKERWEFGIGFDSVELRIAGLWPGDVLLPGEMATVNVTAKAQQLMKWFRAALKKEGFAKLDRYWLGHEAVAMLRAGKRLPTIGASTPPEFDLKPEWLERV